MNPLKNIPVDEIVAVLKVAAWSGASAFLVVLITFTEGVDVNEQTAILVPVANTILYSANRVVKKKLRQEKENMVD